MHATQSKLLAAVTSEAKTGETPSYKFVVNSTIVQHVVPNSQVHRSTGAGSPDGPAAAAGEKKSQAGRRGMYSSTAGYWNEKTDGMWSFKYQGEHLGLDVVLMVVWVHV
jgi:hypothetical protein